MKTGYSKICINPPYGAPISGYYEQRYVKGITSSLYTRAVAFDDGNKKALVIAIDVCLLPLEICDRIRDDIVKATGVDKNAIFMNFSHTHTGPLVGQNFATNDKSSEGYDEFFFSCIRDAAIYAIEDLCESRIEIGETEAKNISFIRRYRMKDGSVVTNPGPHNDNILEPLGTPNEALKLVKIVRDGKNDIAMINFGTHADSVGGEYINADYVGYACDTVETAIPGTDAIFLIGPQGDVNHVNVNTTKAERAILNDLDTVCPHSDAHAKHMGRVLAGAVLSIYSITEEMKTDKITFGSKIVDLPSNQDNDRLDEAKRICEFYDTGRKDELPYKEMDLVTVVSEACRIVRLENGPDSFPFLLSAIKVGELVFAGIGGEPFVEIGVRISEQSPYKNTIVCCLTNNYGGYIPTSSCYDEGGYESRTTDIKRGGDDIIVDGMTELLKSL